MSMPILRTILPVQVAYNYNGLDFYRPNLMRSIMRSISGWDDYKTTTEKAKGIWLGADHLSAQYRTKLWLASPDLIC
jgi:hypothetical protein